MLTAPFCIKAQQGHDDSRRRTRGNDIGEEINQPRGRVPENAASAQSKQCSGGITSCVGDMLKRAMGFVPGDESHAVEMTNSTMRHALLRRTTSIDLSECTDQQVRSELFLDEKLNNESIQPSTQSVFMNLFEINLSDSEITPKTLIDIIDMINRYRYNKERGISLNLQNCENLKLSQEQGRPAPRLALSYIPRLENLEELNIRGLVLSQYHNLSEIIVHNILLQCRKLKKITLGDVIVSPVQLNLIRAGLDLCLRNLQRSMDDIMHNSVRNSVTEITLTQIDIDCLAQSNLFEMLRECEKLSKIILKNCKISEELKHDLEDLNENIEIEYENVEIISEPNTAAQES